MRRFGKLATVILGAVLAGSMTVGLAGCGDGAPEGAEEITFWYEASLSNNRIYRDLIDTYNNGRGKEDGVWVEGDNRQNMDATQLYVSPTNVLLMTDESEFKSFAHDNLSLDMAEYYNSIPGHYHAAGRHAYHTAPCSLYAHPLAAAQ